MINTTFQEKLTKSDLKNYFLKGIKSSQQIGIEYEKIGVDCVTNQAIPFEKMEKLLQKMLEFEDYTPIFNNQTEKNLIGLKNEFSNISLEPGSQFELSLNPCQNLKELDKKIKNHNKITENLAQNLGIKWVGYGLQPLSTYSDIKIIPKERYKIMTEYLPQVAKHPLIMMRETAGIQVGIDYKSEEDAIKKLKLSLKLAPIVSAVYSNSPIRNGKLSGYKSLRAYSWLHTDNERCGLISKKLFDKNSYFSFDDYIKILSDVQMIMVNTSKGQIPVNNFTFNNFLANGYGSKQATIDDFEQHASLYFTDTRLKQYLEIRNHDSQKSQYIISIPAFWKSVMYNKNAFLEINKILDKFSYEDFENIRHNAPIKALDYKINNYKLSELAKEIFNISYQTLKLTNEEKYLEPILELVLDGLTPADIIIKNFNTIWHGDIKNAIEFACE